MVVMKIVIASDIYYPMTNGVAVFAHNLAVGLARRGHEVLVICPSFTGKAHKNRREIPGLTTAYLTSIRFPFYPDQIHKVPKKKEFLGVELPRLVYKNGIWASINPVFEVRKLLNEFKPDVIHLQTAETIAVAIAAFARRYEIPLVATNHAYPDNVTGQFKFLKPIKRPVDSVITAYMNSFLAHSEYATMPTEMAIEDMIPKKFKVQVEALSNGVDLSQFKPGKPTAKVLKKFGLEAGRPRVMNVGRVDPEKSIDVLIEAFAKVVKGDIGSAGAGLLAGSGDSLTRAADSGDSASVRSSAGDSLTRAADSGDLAGAGLGGSGDSEGFLAVPEAELVIVGDGTAKAALEEKAVALGISENVKFLGRVYPPELNELYRAGDLFATASETETQGIVLIEAAATGLPLVAVDKGAVRELCLDSKNGFLCEAGNTDELARSMARILSDARMRKRFSAASLEVAKKHDINHTLERLEEIYQVAIEARKMRAETE